MFALALHLVGRADHAHAISCHLESCLHEGHLHEVCMYLSNYSTHGLCTSHILLSGHPGRHPLSGRTVPLIPYRGPARADRLGRARAIPSGTVRKETRCFKVRWNLPVCLPNVSKGEQCVSSCGQRMANHQVCLEVRSMLDPIPFQRSLPTLQRTGDEDLLTYIHPRKLTWNLRIYPQGSPGVFGVPCGPK